MLDAPRDDPRVANFQTAFSAYCGKHTDAPAILHTYSAIAVCCAALANRVFVQAGWGRVLPSLWIAFVGPSNIRKSTSVNTGADLLREAAPSLLLPEDFTREAIFSHLATQPFGLLRWPEIGVPLESFAKDYQSGIMSTLVDVFDSRPSITRLTVKHGLVDIKYPALTILAGGKERWFKDYVTAKTLRTGFIGRWLFVTERQAGEYVSFFGKNGREADRIVRESLIDHLAILAQYEGEMLPGEGKPVLDDWLQALERRWDDESDPAEFSKRAGANVVKLAMGIQACRGTRWLGELHPVAVKEAIALWEHAFSCGAELIRGILGQSREADDLDRIAAEIKKARSITREELIRAVRMKAFTLDQYVDTLLEGGRIQAEQRQRDDGRPGRPKTIYRWVK